MSHPGNRRRSALGKRRVGARGGLAPTLSDRPMPTIDVTVIADADQEAIGGCLRHLSAQTARHDVVLCEVGPRRWTDARLLEIHPGARLVRLSCPSTQTVARNAAVAAGGGEILVNVGVGVDPHPDFLERVVAPFASRPRLGSVAALVLCPGEMRIDSAGLAGDRTLAGFPRLRGCVPERAQERRPVLLGPVGMAAAFRRLAWEQVGGVDEALPGELEDLDLALRLRSAGWETALAGDAVAVASCLARAQSLRPAPADPRSCGRLRRRRVGRTRTALAALAGSVLALHHSQAVPAPPRR